MLMEDLSTATRYVVQYAFASVFSDVTHFISYLVNWLKSTSLVVKIL